MNTYQQITDQVIALLEKGVCPWKHFLNQPEATFTYPSNFKNQTRYRGINFFLLSAFMYDKGYNQNSWLTFKQAKELGGQVRKGEKGVSVVFWNWLYVDAEGNKVSNPSDAAEKIPFIKRYVVFNIDQIDGLDIEPLPEPTTIDFQPIQRCEQVVNQMPKKPVVRNLEPKAYYSPINDLVNLPKPERCNSEAEYYSAMFHELIHATGHQSRLDRKEITEPTYFGSHSYSKEELVAEMGAAFLCAETGISTQVIENQAAYIEGWLKVLKGDHKLIIEAAAKAQKAVDFILNKNYSVA